MTERTVTSETLADWKIDTMHHRNNGRWTWAINYPISKFAIVGTRDFASNSSAHRDAYRCIRALIGRRPNVE